MPVLRVTGVTGTLPRRLEGIDLGRGIAALVVVLSHSIQTVTTYTPWWVQTASPKAVAAIATVTRELGAWGVGLFFVLSGLCIHLPMARSDAREGAWRTVDVPSYAKRRFIRIYPPHFLILLASALLGLVLPGTILSASPLITHPTLTQFIAHVFMVHPFVPGALYSINSVLWTIAFEAQFYILYPLLLWARRRLGLGFGVITVALVLLAAACRVASKRSGPLMAMWLGQTFLVRWWEWTLGCWLADQMVVKGAPARSATRFLSLSLVSFALGLAMLAIPLGLTLRSLLWPVAFAGLLWTACGIRTLGTSGERFLSQAGLRGYTLYLIHPVALALGAWISEIWALGLLARVALAVSLVGGATMAFYRLVERPFQDAAASIAVPMTPLQVPCESPQ